MFKPKYGHVRIIVTVGMIELFRDKYSYFLFNAVMWLLVKYNWQALHNKART
jgi:hypothetical protein